GGRALEMRDHVAHADAADLLVVRDGEMNRPGELARRHVGHRRETAGDEALHVGGAAAEQTAVALLEPKRIARPGLPVDRHHVGMAGEDVPRLVPWPEGDPDVALRTALVGN